MRPVGSSHTNPHHSMRDLRASADEGGGANQNGEDNTQTRRGNAREAPPRRQTNRDLLNAIARNIGAGLPAALTSLGQSLHYTPPDTGPQGTSIAMSSRHGQQLPTIDDVITAFIDAGIPFPGARLALDGTLESRFIDLQLSPNTIIAAINLLQHPEHPSLVELGANTHVLCQSVLKDLSSLIKARCIARVATAAKDSNDDPIQLIANVLSADCYRCGLRSR